jgi:hypothetical protein
LKKACVERLRFINPCGMIIPAIGVIACYILRTVTMLQKVFHLDVFQLQILLKALTEYHSEQRKAYVQIFSSATQDTAQNVTESDFYLPQTRQLIQLFEGKS